MARTIDTLATSDIRGRWPRLLAVIRWAGLLTEEQALATLYCYKGCGLDCSVIAEVTELGGNVAAIRAGIRSRHAARAARGMGDRVRARETGLQAFLAAVAPRFPRAAVALPDEVTIDLVLAADAVIEYLSRRHGALARQTETRTATAG